MTAKKNTTEESLRRIPTQPALKLQSHIFFLSYLPVCYTIPSFIIHQKGGQVVVNVVIKKNKTKEQIVPPVAF